MSCRARHREGRPCATARRPSRKIGHYSLSGGPVVRSIHLQNRPRQRHAAGNRSSESGHCRHVNAPEHTKKCNRKSRVNAGAGSTIQLARIPCTRLLAVSADVVCAQIMSQCRRAGIEGSPAMGQTMGAGGGDAGNARRRHAENISCSRAKARVVIDPREGRCRR